MLCLGHVLLNGCSEITMCIVSMSKIAMVQPNSGSCHVPPRDSGGLVRRVQSVSTVLMGKSSLSKTFRPDRVIEVVLLGSTIRLFVRVSTLSTRAVKLRWPMLVVLPVLYCCKFNTRRT